MSIEKKLFFEDMSNSKCMRGAKHYHDVLELYFMEKGNCKYFIDTKVYHVREGDLILIPEGVLHKTMYSSGERARVLIYCSSHYVPVEVTDKLPALLHLYRNPALVPRLRELIAQIRREYTNADAFSPSVLTGLMHLLFYTLVREAGGCESVHAENLYASRAIAHIKMHYAEPITLAAVAAMLSVSPEHLSRVFKKETGFGFSEYLTTLRLQQAEAMLKGDPALRISDVAFACGFNDSNYFSQCFRKAYGFAPGKLKRSKPIEINRLHN